MVAETHIHSLSRPAAHVAVAAIQLETHTQQAVSRHIVHDVHAKCMFAHSIYVCTNTYMHLHNSPNA
jgi:hypothetical protein